MAPAASRKRFSEKAAQIGKDIHKAADKLAKLTKRRRCPSIHARALGFIHTYREDARHFHLSLTTRSREGRSSTYRLLLLRHTMHSLFAKKHFPNPEP